MLRTSEKTDKQHLGADMRVNSDRDKETGNCNAVRNFLYQTTGGSKSRVGEVLTAVVVDDNADCKIGRNDSSLADEERLIVVARLTHLSNDIEELQSVTYPAGRSD